MREQTFGKEYRKFFELYGNALTADYSGISRSFVSRYAKNHNWKSPNTAQVRKNLISKILIK